MPFVMILVCVFEKLLPALPGSIRLPVLQEEEQGSVVEKAVIFLTSLINLFERNLKLQEQQRRQQKEQQDGRHK
jgi:hypothetical protein